MEPLFRQEVVQHKVNRLDGTVSLIQPAAFKWLALLLVTIIVCSIIFLAAGEYSKKERVIGVVQPDSGLLKLTSPQSGIVKIVLVTEGERVEKGQPILRVESLKHGVDGFELNRSRIDQYQFQINMLTLQINKQHSQNTLQTQNLTYSKSNIAAKLDELERQSEIINQRIKINNSLSKQMAVLAEQGYTSKLDLNRQIDASLTIKQQSSSTHSQKLTLNNELSQIVNQLSQLPIEHAKVLDQLQSQLTEAQLNLAIVEQESLAELRAPMSGKVTGILTKAGKSVSSQQFLLSVLPENSKMQAVLFIPTSAFGFIEIGQQVRLRYHAFPYEKFGIFDGEIIEVSSNVILPEETELPGMIKDPSYRVVVSLSAQEIVAYGKSTPLRADMMLDADIIVERRSLLAWLFDPILSLHGKL
ncbi:HlyD family efflux transporter periplasmic adaptor subunit [Shewanella abyssi]|uniref:HlyD family secretion protein n=1 Tax=Shewanella abyssi TaxID=311789 RepID=UPI00200E463D|nr:HlyD family efflux transporter periplasmic adaptor subunit [Shewanella abyssi]MCL1052156.1 HlyD family efflux transporter periplasmic adaptor subunit [Shewanella abyssi]